VNAYPFIEAEKGERRNVTRACELMEVSRSAFYEWHRHQPTRRELGDRELGQKIAEIHSDSRASRRPGRRYAHPASGQSWSPEPRLRPSTTPPSLAQTAETVHA
jgi:hypothetical protein